MCCKGIGTLCRTIDLHIVAIPLINQIGSIRHGSQNIADLRGTLGHRGAATLYSYNRFGSIFQ